MADVKITQLDPGVDPVGDELVEAVQSGGSVRLTLDQIKKAQMVTSGSAAYTLLLTDRFKILEMTSASANTVTIPPDSSVDFPIGAAIIVRQFGAGATSILAGVGVTALHKASVTLTLFEQYSEVVLQKRAANSWLVTGELTPA
ncbi:minor tail protein [Shewanella phage S0112]|nr:minor tail protein [Shewanella phage S0112]